jgi:hypothetical protein
MSFKGIRDRNQYRKSNTDPLRNIVAQEPRLLCPGFSPVHDILECGHALLPASDLAGTRYNKVGGKRRCPYCAQD